MHPPRERTHNAFMRHIRLDPATVPAGSHHISTTPGIFRLNLRQNFLKLRERHRPGSVLRVILSCRLKDRYHIVPGVLAAGKVHRPPGRNNNHSRQGSGQHNTARKLP